MTEHTVIALVGRLPKRVQCALCESQHNYRSTRGNSRPSTPRSTQPESRRKSASRWQVELAQKAQTDIQPRAYDTAETFDLGDVIDHPSFGMGIVKEVIPGGKVKILFSSGKRLLAHSRSDDPS